MKNFIALIAVLCTMAEVACCQVATGSWNTSYDLHITRGDGNFTPPPWYDYSSSDQLIKYKYVYSRDYYDSHPTQANGGGSNEFDPNLFLDLRLIVTGGTNITISPVVSQADYVGSVSYGGGGFSNSTGTVQFSVGYSVTSVSFYVSRPDLVEILPASTFYQSNSQYSGYYTTWTNQNYVILLKSGSGVQTNDLLGIVRASIVIDGVTVDSQDVYLKAGSPANIVTPPAAPSSVYSTFVSGPNYIVTNWGDNASNESGYEIQVSTNSGTFQALGSTSANATSYVHMGTYSGNTYSYRVRAVNSGGSSSWVYGNTVYR
jgi:hypothetical protein